VFTVKDNINLSEVFLAMKASTEAVPDANDARAVKAYFQKVYADIDFDRVYASDMKKMVKWLQIIDKNNIEIKLSEIAQDEADNTIAKAKPAGPKTAAVRSAPPKKINSPRKMA
jgi:broad specificity phosphatase PhoE